MSEVSERYGRIADDLTTRIAALSEADWSARTPCPEWTVTDLVGHVVDVHGRILARLHDTEPEAPVGDELAAQWALRSGSVAAALLDPDLAGRRVQGMGGEQTFEELAGGLLCVDTLVHTWDLARAAGQDERLDEGAVRAATTMLTALGDAIRAPGGFGAAVEPAADADEQTAMLNFCGREV